MPMSAADIYEALNTSYSRLGYGVGNNPTVIDDSNIESIGVLPESQVNALFHEFNKMLVERWFSNSLNESAKGLFRFVIRNEGDHGFGIIDRFVNLVEAVAYPSTGADIAADLVSPVASPIDVKKFTDPYAPGRYKGTIRRQELRKFLTPGGMTEYISFIETNLFQSAEYGMMMRVAAMMKAAIEAGTVPVVTGIDMNTENGLASLVESMMTAVDGFRQPTALFNVGERIISTPEAADVVIVTTPSRWNRVRARLLADRYHLDQLYVDGRVIFAPEGTDLGTVTDLAEVEHEVEFIVTDARGWCLDITTMELRPFEVSNMNYLNEFLHVEGVEGSVPSFVNCIAFAGDYGNFTEPVEPANNTPIQCFGQVGFAYIKIYNKDNVECVSKEGLLYSENQMGVNYYYNTEIATTEVGGKVVFTPPAGIGSNKFYMTVWHKDGTATDVEETTAYEYTFTENDVLVNVAYHEPII